VKHSRPDRHAHELGRIWQLLTIHERNYWLRLARDMGDKSAKANTARLFHTALILAVALMMFFPFSLRSAMVAIAAGYVLAVNLAIVRVYLEGIRSR
jgi:hypothetical protein